MKKLGKKLHNMQETIEAYNNCSCFCYCSCVGTTNWFSLQSTKESTPRLRAYR